MLKCPSNNGRIGPICAPDDLVKNPEKRFQTNQNKSARTTNQSNEITQDPCRPRRVTAAQIFAPTLHLGKLAHPAELQRSQHGNYRERNQQGSTQRKGDREGLVAKQLTRNAFDKNDWNKYTNGRHG